MQLTFQELQNVLGSPPPQIHLLFAAFIIIKGKKISTEKGISLSWSVQQVSVENKKYCNTHCKVPQRFLRQSLHGYHQEPCLKFHFSGFKANISKYSEIHHIWTKPRSWCYSITSCFMDFFFLLQTWLWYQILKWNLFERHCKIKIVLLRHMQFLVFFAKVPFDLRKTWNRLNLCGSEVHTYLFLEQLTKVVLYELLIMRWLHLVNTNLCVTYKSPINQYLSRAQNIWYRLAFTCISVKNADPTHVMLMWSNIGQFLWILRILNYWTLQYTCNQCTSGSKSGFASSLTDFFSS